MAKGIKYGSNDCECSGLITSHEWLNKPGHASLTEAEQTVIELVSKHILSAIAFRSSCEDGGMQALQASAASRPQILCDMIQCLALVGQLAAHILAAGHAAPTFACVPAIVLW